MSKAGQFDLRVVLYAEDITDSRVTYHYPDNEDQDNFQHMSDILEGVVESGNATGGHIEELVEFQGGDKVYVMALTDEEVLR